MLHNLYVFIFSISELAMLYYAYPNLCKYKVFFISFFQFRFFFFFAFELYESTTKQKQTNNTNKNQNIMIEKKSFIQIIRMYIYVIAVMKKSTLWKLCFACPYIIIGFTCWVVLSGYAGGKVWLLVCSFLFYVFLIMIFKYY